MGIKNLNSIIKKKSPTSYVVSSIKDFSGLRIAVDGNNWLYMNMATARKNVISETNILVDDVDTSMVITKLISNLIAFCNRLLFNNITPVFVFDGKAIPEKNDTKQKRKEQLEKTKEKIDELTLKIHNSDLNISVSDISELKRQMSNYNNIPFEIYDTVKQILKSIGIPVLQAAGEGEKLCSMLCREGKVSAVFSTDTDNIVYGCPIVITKIYGTYSDTRFECMIIKQILKDFNFTYEQFVDFCIMCGCDFNTNIPGFAGKRSFDMIEKYKNIEGIEGIDKTCLNYVKCREIFSPVDSTTVCECEINIDIDKKCVETCRPLFESIKCDSYIDKIYNYMMNISNIKNGYPFWFDKY